jgi:tyrosyl-tRNA synthetase
MTGFYEDLQWRGLVHQMTDNDTLPKLLNGDSLVVYIGFDPSASSLHIGNLLQVCTLRRLQQGGHRPIALVGGGTGMIGDPSGKSEERNLLSPDQLEENKAGIKRQLSSFVDFEPLSGQGAVLADNADWLAQVGLLEFLRDVGKFFSVNEMSRKDSVRARLEGRDQGLSFTEFSYMLLQAWDFLQLYDRFGCRLQVGGSDQWGNITEGVDLIRRRREVQAFGFTSPLVTKADGTKFGKTETGTVWLDPGRTSPYEFFQFWVRTEDSDVGRFLRNFTFLDREAIEDLDRITAGDPGRRQAQRVLAREVTGLVHGPGVAARAERAAAVLFTPEVVELDLATLEAGLADAPRARIGLSELEGMSVVDALVLAGLAASKNAARRLVAEGAVSVNNRRVAAERLLGAGDALHGRFVLLRRGRSYSVLVVEP